MVPKLKRQGESIEIEAPLPNFFIESMNRLGFSSEYSKWNKEPDNKPRLVKGLVDGDEIDSVKDPNLRTAR
jgi:hypothetical protein